MKKRFQVIKENDRLQFSIVENMADGRANQIARSIDYGQDKRFYDVAYKSAEELVKAANRKKS